MKAWTGKAGVKEIGIDCLALMLDTKSIHADETGSFMFLDLDEGERLAQDLLDAIQYLRTKEEA